MSPSGCVLYNVCVTNWTKKDPMSVWFFVYFVRKNRGYSDDDFRKRKKKTLCLPEIVIYGSSLMKERVAVLSGCV